MTAYDDSGTLTHYAPARQFDGVDYRRGAQSRYSPLAILTALTLRAVFRLAYRQAEGLLGPIVSLLGLEWRVPDHTALSRRAATLEIPAPR